MMGGVDWSGPRLLGLGPGGFIDRARSGNIPEIGSGSDEVGERLGSVQWPRDASPKITPKSCLTPLRWGPHFAEAMLQKGQADLIAREALVNPCCPQMAEIALGHKAFDAMDDWRCSMDGGSNTASARSGLFATMRRRPARVRQRLEADPAVANAARRPLTRSVCDQHADMCSGRVLEVAVEHVAGAAGIEDEVQIAMQAIARIQAHDALRAADVVVVNQIHMALEDVGHGVLDA